MKTVYAFFAFCALLASGSAFSAPNPALLDLPAAGPAPQVITLDSYMKWATPMLKPEYASAFTANIFSWFENEKSRGLPQETYNDPGKIFISVDRPLQETIALEDGGEIEIGNTVGAEVYMLMDGNVHEVMETILYRWGKPTGAADGQTYTPGGQFARRIDYFAANPSWGPQAFASLGLRRDGGIVNDLADRYIVLVRGNDAQGYDVLMQYVRPGGKTASKQCFAIAIIRPEKDGKTSYKLSTRFQGQNYKMLGSVRLGRAQVGFNVAKVRGIQEEVQNMLRELRSTGKIADHKTDIEYGKGF